MNLMLSFAPQPVENKISYKDKCLLMGSCFSDNMGLKLSEAKFQTMFNPTGIVFDPLSLARHLMDCANNTAYVESDLFVQNELWHSWNHHSQLSSISANQTLDTINNAIVKTHEQLKTATYLFITLGTAFSYQLKSTNTPVANCHKAPKDLFHKVLLPIEQIIETLQNSIKVVKKLNPQINIVFTVSPVKHVRDGIIENVQSKTRLIEAVYQLTSKENQCSYFPAYELVTEVLRDYRFYAADMVHPSEQAIQYVYDFFCETYLSSETQQIMKEVQTIVSASRHRVLHPQTSAHNKFLKSFLLKTEELKQKLPYLNWDKELAYFKSGS